MAEHVLKTLPPYFDATARGDKPFDVRRDDRGFQKGDTLRLREFLPRPPGLTSYERERNSFTGREIICDVLWILTGGQFGIEPGFVVMGLRVRPTPDQQSGGGNG